MTGMWLMEVDVAAGVPESEYPAADRRIQAFKTGGGACGAPGAFTSTA
jgi:hypothetical protein